MKSALWIAFCVIGFLSGLALFFGRSRHEPSPKQPLAISQPPVIADTSQAADIPSFTSPPATSSAPATNRAVAVQELPRFRQTGHQVDENEIAKTIIEENASWLYVCDGQGRPMLNGKGERMLSPLGQRYAYYVGRAEQAGVRGPINQHAWAVAKLSGEVKRSQRPASKPPLQVKNPLGALEGCSVISQDDQYLGKITWDDYDPDSILNKYAPYGRKTSPTSIFNEVGLYGSAEGKYSAFNPFSSTPPRIITPHGESVAYLTANPSKTPRLDPGILVEFLNSK